MGKLRGVRGISRRLRVELLHFPQSGKCAVRGGKNLFVLERSFGRETFRRGEFFLGKTFSSKRDFFWKPFCRRKFFWGNLFLFRENLFVKGSPSPSKSGLNRVYLKSALKMAVIFAWAKSKTCNRNF